MEVSGFGALSGFTLKVRRRMQSQGQGQARVFEGVRAGKGQCRITEEASKSTLLSNPGPTTHPVPLWSTT